MLRRPPRSATALFTTKKAHSNPGLHWACQHAQLDTGVTRVQAQSWSREYHSLPQVSSGSSSFPSDSAAKLLPGLSSRCRRDAFISGWKGAGTLLTGSKPNEIKPAIALSHTAMFHTTPRREGAPIIPLLALLKTATSLELLRTLGRIALTFTPVLLLKNMKIRRILKMRESGKFALSDEKVLKATERMRKTTIWLHILFSIPCLMFWATIIACLERTPLTGRWRLIILSPEEEEEIASQLAGPGWYQAVDEILSKDGPPKIIVDWRYNWVRDTLRRLEAIVPILQRETDLGDTWTSGSTHNDGAPLPPPADYPLLPRPRAAESLKLFCDMVCDKRIKKLQKQAIAGPPYSLLLVERPDASNAFSYGFGADGGGGIVVYSGFLDEILAEGPNGAQCREEQAPKSAWSSFLGIFKPSSPAPSHPVPTQEQTTKLAILLAHELSHLLLAHHLESLSSSSVMLPGVVSILTDVARVVIFPLTMLFGPFVNDAVAQLGKVGSLELSKMGEYCNSVTQEIEADVVSARLLAHAGFDAREAIRFWEDRSQKAEVEPDMHCHTPHGTGASTSEIEATSSSAPASSTYSEADASTSSTSQPNALTHSELRQHANATTSALSLPNIPALPALRILGNTHPVNATRVQKLKAELVRWETEKRAVKYRRETLGIKLEDEMEKWRAKQGMW